MSDKERFEALFNYRMEQADDALLEARNSLTTGLKVNRAYYAMFYSLLALFIKDKQTIKTSKHQGVIGFFNKEYIYTKKLNQTLYITLTTIFRARLKADYKEMIIVSEEDAERYIVQARQFVDTI